MINLTLSNIEHECALVRMGLLPVLYGINVLGVILPRIVAVTGAEQGVASVVPT